MIQIVMTVVLWLSALSVQAATEVAIYTYHNHPPFITGQGRGLTHDLVDLLNQKVDGQFQFVLKVLPRKRLNATIKRWVSGECKGNDQCDHNWAILWVNQKWGFGKQSEVNFSWSRLLQDSNSILSNQSAPIQYRQPSDLDGKVFAGTNGHRYVGIDERVKAGKIQRIDGSRERSHLLKLYQRRVDATLLPTSTTAYFLSSDPQLSKLADHFYIAETKHQSYMRHIMVPVDQQPLIEWIGSLDLEHDPAWATLKQRYGL